MRVSDYDPEPRTGCADGGELVIGSTRVGHRSEGARSKKKQLRDISSAVCSFSDWALFSLFYFIVHSHIFIIIIKGSYHLAARAYIAPG